MAQWIAHRTSKIRSNPGVVGSKISEIPIMSAVSFFFPSINFS